MQGEGFRWTYDRIPISLGGPAREAVVVVLDWKVFVEAPLRERLLGMQVVVRLPALTNNSKTLKIAHF